MKIYKSMVISVILVVIFHRNSMIPKFNYIFKNIIIKCNIVLLYYTIYYIIVL